MKKFLMLLATTACLATAACQPTAPLANPNPGGTSTPTGGTGSTSGTASLATKAQFIAYMNCLKNNPSVDAEARTAIDLQINAVNQIPEAQWAYISAGFSTFVQTYAKFAGC